MVWRSSACTPQYAFEKVPGNVAKGRGQSGHQLSGALDNSYAADQLPGIAIGPPAYLIDATGTVRHIKFGESDFNV